ncbi:hypothetical protein [Nocardioides sp. PD653]|uniref:hypothetical protein n=1 Tax=Nocardioides sp. PD653 TaxID=393303 RepID=UPI0009F01F05|nr:hypothetical protein [Nocardioides sp. PD653]GAW54737.1 uncharacterized protein PD653_2151 [Nocardioides sp. PD653]
MPQPLHESVRTLAEATTSDDAGLLEVEFITPGWGSSGYYSPEVVEAAAPLFAVGTHMYFDHPSATEDHDRPERSVRDLAAVIEEGGVVDSTTGGVRGKVRPLKAYQDLLTDEAFTKNVGLSIRGSATDIVVGEAEGRRGPIIEGLADLSSVDFVTRAGRGGRVLAVLESARIVESTANDTREALQTVVRDAYGGEKTYVWVCDFDPDPEVMTVWFEVEAPDGEDSGVFAQTYTDSDGAVALAGDRTEVRRVTNYVPVTRPDSNTTTATESQEDTMPKIQIEESEHTRLTETAGRVDALESENATLKTQVETLQEADAQRTRTDRAKALIAESEHVFTPLEARALLADLPVVEADSVKVLDETEFTKRLDEASKESAATLGAKVGVHGFGASATTEVTESGRPATSPWGRPLAEQKGA